MKLQRGINEAAVPFLMHMEKRSHFIESNMYRTEKNIEKASQGTSIETRIKWNGVELWWTPKRKDQNNTEYQSKTKRTR